MRERWLGATGRRVPEIAVDGELELPDDVLWLEQASPDDVKAAHAAGRPVAAHADTPQGVKDALNFRSRATPAEIRMPPRIPHRGDQRPA